MCALVRSCLRLHEKAQECWVHMCLRMRLVQVQVLMQSASANHYLSPTFPSLLVEKKLNPL
jgi:hypothetical protein